MLIVIMPEKGLSSNWEKVTKYNLRIISKSHKTVGGVAHTVPTTLGGQKDGKTDAKGQNVENYVPMLFFEKVGDKDARGC